MPWTDVGVVPLLFVARTKVEYGFDDDSGANSVDRHSTATGSLRSFDMATLIWSELKKGISSRKSTRSHCFPRWLTVPTGSASGEAGSTVMLGCVSITISLYKKLRGTFVVVRHLSDACVAV